MLTATTARYVQRAHACEATYSMQPISRSLTLRFTNREESTDTYQGAHPVELA
jgi:hypothetical protein